MPEFVAALDQGTTSTRCMIFDHDGRERGRAQLEHRQILPRPGWVEHDPVEILDRARAVLAEALADARLDGADIAACGVTNQRETTVVWNRRTGRPYHHALVWQDTRTAAGVAALEAGGHGEQIREVTGLPPSTYFSGPKLRWLLDEIPGLRADAEAGDALFGTIDSWLVWHLTGGMHLTDVTNASRTLLMDLEALAWDDELLDLLTIPRAMLPAIGASSDADRYGVIGDGPLRGVPVTAVLGDQHAATVGQACFAPGEAKNTYGTGNFLILNTGAMPVRSRNGLLSTVAYQFAGQQAVYALEGSIAVTGSAVGWLRDQLGVLPDAAAIEDLAGQVPDTGGVYFVPAFSGLFAPYWRSDARGAIVGLSRFSSRAHLARATLEAICYQTRDVVTAMEEDAGARLDALKVDGGVTANELCMQIQADVLGIPVSRPEVGETTALGAAYAAGLAVGLWKTTDELRDNWREHRRWQPRWDEDRRRAACAGWAKAVARSLDWVEL